MSRRWAFPHKEFMKLLGALTVLACSVSISSAFIVQRSSHLSKIHPITLPSYLSTTPWKEESSLEELSKEELMSDAMTKSTQQLKTLLVDTILSMSQLNSIQFKLIMETCINALEQKYVAPMTLDFLNLIMSGEWIFLFSTNQPKIYRQLLITDISTNVVTNDLKGHVLHRASFNYLEEQETRIDGVFTSNTPYTILQGSRMTIGNECNLSLSISKGSKHPREPQELVAWIRKAMPTEMFDPCNLAMDTTFVDPDIRIVRWTGSPRHEGIRYVYIRQETISKFKI